MIELLLTVVILMVGIVSVARLVPLATSSNLRNRNDTTSLVAAQSMLEQKMNPCEWNTTTGCTPLRPNYSLGLSTTITCPNPSAWSSPTNTWAFCDGANAYGYGIVLGRSNPGASATVADGCPVVTTAGSLQGQIDWTQPSTACGNYTQTETNPVTGVQIEYRWRVIQMSDANSNPYRKVLIVAARQKQAAGANYFSNVVANVVGVMGKQGQ